MAVSGKISSVVDAFPYRRLEVDLSFDFFNDSLVFRYSKALYDIAKAQDKISEFLEEIKVVRESLESIEDSEKLFKRFTLIPKDGEILINTLADELDLCSEIKNFLKLVLWNHRFSEILDICQSYEEVCDREKGRIFHVTFATRFPEEKRKELLDAIRELNEDKGTVKIIENGDESLVGGFQVRHKSKLLDYSVKSQLIRLKAAMRGENRVY